MVYLGSKSKYAKYIVPILQTVIDKKNVKLYIENFCGGGNIIDKIKCEKRIGYDRSDTLIALLKQAQEDFTKIPKSITREMWDEGKAYVKDGIPPKTMSLADIGAVEFFGSFGTRGFPGCMAKDSKGHEYYKERYNNLLNQAPNLKGIEFVCQSYQDFVPVKGAVIYEDPPYLGTKTYGYANQPKMDYEHFWNWIRELSKDNYVFVSEQTAPEDFEVVLEIEGVTRTIGSDNNYKATEKLFRYKEGLK